jgi:hypothetical protein
MLRMAGHWNPWLDTYAAYPEVTKRHNYDVLRYIFYQRLHNGIVPDWANKQGL